MQKSSRFASRGVGGVRERSLGALFTHGTELFNQLHVHIIFISHFLVASLVVVVVVIVIIVGFLIVLFVLLMLIPISARRWWFGAL